MAFGGRVCLFVYFYFIYNMLVLLTKTVNFAGYKHFLRLCM